MCIANVMLLMPLTIVTGDYQLKVSREREREKESKISIAADVRDLKRVTKATRANTLGLCRAPHAMRPRDGSLLRRDVIGARIKYARDSARLRGLAAAKNGKYILKHNLAEGAGRFAARVRARIIMDFVIRRNFGNPPMGWD